VKGSDQRQPLLVRQSLSVRDTATLPGTIITEAHLQGIAQIRQREVTPMPVNPGVLHRASLAKYAAAFTQLRKVCSTSPNSLATTPALSPAFTRFTVSSLNSGV